MLRIGCHLSSARGYLAMGKEAVEIGANTFQFFTRNPRGGRVKPLDTEDIKSYVSFAAEHDLTDILAHAPYTVNPSSAKEDLRDFAINVLREDLERLELIPGSMLNFHPGSHVKQGVERGIDFIVHALDLVLTPGQKTLVLLETMSGKGTEVGASFEELETILERVHHDELLGVCLDTCHVHDSGFDIVCNLDSVLEEFDRIIGLSRLRAIHLNDSKNPRGSRKDRHEKIGEGEIGLEALARIINHPLLRDLPFYLETPNDLPGYAHEIQLLRRLYRNK